MRHRTDGPRAIILGVEHPRSVAAIQSLGRAGVPIVAIDDHPPALGFSSRYVGTSLTIEPNHDSALAVLERLGRDGGGVLIPTTDAFDILVSKNWDRLSRHLTLTMPPWDVLESLMDVCRCYRIAQDLGIKTPSFFKPRDEEELESFLHDLDLGSQSYLLKTRPGTQPADTRTGRFTKVAGSDPQAIADNCREIYGRLGEFPVIVRVVPGEADRCIGVCMVVDRNGEAVVCYCVRRLRLYTYSRGGQFVHPYELGANVYCESVHDAEAVEAARRLMQRTGYYGPIAIEFRRDSTDESLTLIKADPRVVRATGLSTALGMDIPRNLYDAFTSRPVRRASAYPDGIAWIWLSQYLGALWANRANRPITRELFRLLRRCRKIKAVANLDLRDPMPFLVEQKRWWAGFLKGLMRGVWNRWKPKFGGSRRSAASAEE